MLYERIIIGAGAAGLFCAACGPVKNGMIIEKRGSPGRKLLLSGSGQCNLTHGGSIKDFIGHYGPGGPKIRTALYKSSNSLLMKFFEDRGLPLAQREDGKVFPSSCSAAQVLELLLRLVRENGWELCTDCPVTALTAEKNGTYTVNDRYRAKQVVVATGGCSYPATGSDGSMFAVLENLGLKIRPLKPALVPVTVNSYPYGKLSGISFKDAAVTIDGHRLTADLLLTHSSFSGPAVLNLSRYAKPGGTMEINYAPHRDVDLHPQGDHRQAVTFLAEGLELPKRFLEIILARAGPAPDAKASALTGKDWKRISGLLTRDTFSISGTSGFGAAMATRGGVALEEVDLKTFECKEYPGLYIIGEALDIDGDTGGYNLQFAFSSGRGAASVCCN